MLQDQTIQLYAKTTYETCDVLVEAGLGVREDALRVEATEFRELSLPRAPKVFCKSVSGCNCA